MHVTVLGDGAWGTAVASVLADNGHTVALWCYDEQVYNDIVAERINKKYLPGLVLSKSITPVLDIQKSLENAEIIFEAVPVAFLRPVLSKIVLSDDDSRPWVILSKGIENGTLMFPTQIVNDVFGRKITSAVAMGPTFAKDLVAKQPTGIVVGSIYPKLVVAVASLLGNEYLKAYQTFGVMTLQICAAVKNVIAIGAGILEGAGYDGNTKTFFVIEVLSEIDRLVDHYGGLRREIYHLGGVGDLFLTAFGKHSKNLNFGRRIGAGQTVQSIVDEGGLLPEGVNTARSIDELSRKKKIVLPLCNTVHEILVGKKNADDLVRQLFVS